MRASNSVLGTTTFTRSPPKQSVEPRDLYALPRPPISTNRRVYRDIDTSTDTLPSKLPSVPPPPPLAYVPVELHRTSTPTPAPSPTSSHSPARSPSPVRSPSRASSLAPRPQSATVSRRSPSASLRTQTSRRTADLETVTQDNYTEYSSPPRDPAMVRSISTLLQASSAWEVPVLSPRTADIPPASDRTLNTVDHPTFSSPEANASYQRLRSMLDRDRTLRTSASPHSTTSPLHTLSLRLSPARSALVDFTQTSPLSSRHRSPIPVQRTMPSSFTATSPLAELRVERLERASERKQTIGRIRDQLMIMSSSAASVATRSRDGVMFASHNSPTHRDKSVFGHSGRSR